MFNIFPQIEHVSSYDKIYNHLMMGSIHKISIFMVF